MSPNPWYASLVPEVCQPAAELDLHKLTEIQFRQIPSDQLKPGIDSATQFTSVCINTAIYLPWLVSQCLKNGVVFKRAVLKHIADAAKPEVHHSGKVADSGEGHWTIEAAMEEAAPVYVLSAALFARYRSRVDTTFGDKLFTKRSNRSL